MQLQLAHFSDLHYSDETLAEVDRCFGQAIDEAIARGADVAVITGDTTDHALNAHSPAFLALARRIKRLADHCPVLLLQGTFSHEPPGLLALLALIGANHPIHFSTRLEQVALTHAGSWKPSQHWQFESVPQDMRLLCTCIPTLNKADLATAVGAADAAHMMGEQLARVLAGFAQGHLEARRSGVPVIALSHGTVHGCMTEHGVPMAGSDHEFTSGALFAAEATAFMLGHIHKHQAWSHAGRLIAYAGSIGRLHYGEEGEKGFLLWDVGADDANLSLIPTPARRTLDISFDGPPDMTHLKQLVKEHSLADIWVRVRWQVLEEDRTQVDHGEIERLFGGAAGIKLEGRVLPITRARAEGIARERTVSRQIERWTEVTGIDAREALSCLELLEHRRPEDIAVGILRRAESERGTDDVPPAQDARTDKLIA
jgi:DNA repair protein SbcD/Mre11